MRYRGAKKHLEEEEEKKEEELEENEEEKKKKTKQHKYNITGIDNFKFAVMSKRSQDLMVLFVRG